jgi:hypothetical protein
LNDPDGSGGVLRRISRDRTWRHASEQVRAVLRSAVKGSPHTPHLILTMRHLSH